MLITPLNTDLKMNPDNRYNKFVTERFLKDLGGFLIYYNDKLESFWWINPQTKEWKFEMEKSGTLWWNWGWGNKFREQMGMEDEEFKNLVETYVNITLNIKIKKFLNDNVLGEYIIDCDPHIIECLESRTSNVIPVINIKNFYQIDGCVNDDDMIDYCIKLQEEQKVKDYFNEVDLSGVVDLMIKK